MKKMKKLLSVLLAVVISLSCMSVMASAAPTAYKTVDDLKAVTDGGTLTGDAIYSAYSPYGQVTRLSTEARASIIQDFLDAVLPSLNINMGTVLDVLGLTITINFTSVDNLCLSIDSFKDTFQNGLFSIAAGIVNLGVLEELNFDSWNTGIDRAGDPQLTLFYELFELLSNNTGVVSTVLTDGLDLGIVGGLIGGLDLTGINKIIKDLPSVVKGLIFGLFERWDDTTAEIQTLESAKVGDGKVNETVTTFVKNLFKKDMSISTVKLNAEGTITSAHTLPTTGTRVIYSKSGNVLTAQSYATQKYVDAQAKLGNTVNVGDYYVSAKYVLEQETGTTDYVWHQVNLDEDGNMKTLDDGTYDYVGGATPNLKYYEEGTPLLPSLTTEIDLEAMSAADLLYTFIPPVFRDMAPVVLNGSMKKILGGLFGAKYNYVGDVNSDAVNALADASNAFFTEEQGEYLWEWSNYAVINGTHYYRFEDQIFKADLSNVNNYFYIINWDYEITEDFMDEFVPTNGGSTTDTLLMNLNDFLIKVANAITVESAETTDSASDFTATWTRPDFTAGGNENLVANIKAAAQAVIGLAPQHIFGSDYATNDRCYYNLLMSTDNDTILTGIAAMIVDLVMPSMTLPGASKLIESKAKVGAILAAVIREFAAQLAPEYNYDALIYADFGTTTADPDKTFIDPEAAGLVTDGQTASGYWLDVCLTIGLDVGYEYIRAFADLGEDSSEVLAGVVDQGYGHTGKTYAAGTTAATLQAQWEALLDYIIDWALEKDYKWTWKMENLVDTTGLTIDLATPQDPWVKLGKIFNDLLPVEEILNIDVEDSLWLETTLRDNFILAIVDLRWEDLTNLLIVPEGALRTDNVLVELAQVLKQLVNGLFAKIGGGSYAFIPSAITDFDSLASQANIKTLAVDLLGALLTAYNNGLCDTLFPFLNFFLGWKTDPQVIADPAIWTSFRNGNDYAYLYNNNTANFTQPGEAINADGLNFTKFYIQNNSSGMLETHRDSDVVDHDYEINIRSITSDASINTLTFSYDSVISPYETVEVIIDGTYNGEEAVTVTIAYDYVGKDGQAVGGTQYKSITFLLSNQYEDSIVGGRADGDDDKNYAGIDQYSKYHFTEDIYGTITGYRPSIFSTSADTGSQYEKTWVHTMPEGYETTKSGGFLGIGATVTYTSGTGSFPTGTAATYFGMHMGNGSDPEIDKGVTSTYTTDSTWPSTIAKDGSGSGNLYYALSGVTADTEFPYGVYDMGAVGVKYKASVSSDTKVWEIDFIYYNDYDVYDIYLANKDRGITANSVSADDAAIYNEWNAAFKDIVKYATYPMMTSANGHSSTDYVTTIQPYIPAAIERFEAADEALTKALESAANSAAGADATVPEYVLNLETYLKTDDNYGEKEVNFQDYEYYEYFNYADLRTQARNLVKTYYAPEVLDKYFINGWGIRQEELDQVIDAETNTVKQTAIMATRSEHDAQAIADSQTAHDNWEMPVHTKLYVDDLTARLAYYRQFLTGKEEPNSHLYFLNQEIAHVEAQQFVEADYEANSWARYEKALATAKAVAAGEDEYSSYNSRIFDVKWELMVARKNLLLKADSLIEAGGTADLLANIELAEAIFAMNYDDITLSDAGLALADDPAEAKEIALGHLLFGLGYYYQGRYTSYDAEVKAGIKNAGDLKVDDDGNAQMYNLYNDSAYEYADNDRPNRSANQAKVNACNNNLVACLAYFATEPEYSFDANKETTGVVKITSEADATLETGYIYGITAGDAVENYITYEGCYIEYVASTLSGASVNGTGAVVKTYSDEAKTQQIGEYTVVVFGDMDGNAAVDSNDSVIVMKYDADSITNAFEIDAMSLAGDTDGSGLVDSNDSVIIMKYDADSISNPMDVNPLD